MMAQVVDGLEGTLPFQRSRAAHGLRPVREQELGLRTRPMARSDLDRDVDILAYEVDRTEAGDDTHIDARMLGLELRQARDQELHREGRRDPHRERLVVLRPLNPLGRERGLSEATVDGKSAIVENGAARLPLANDQKLHHVVVRL